ncbi:MAG: glycosyltransferase, partial [Pseudomonadota bacterium]
AWVIGAIGILLCIAYVLYAILKQVFVGTVPSGFTATIGIVTFLSSLQIFFIGIVGEYVGRIHAEVKARPTFIVDWDLSKINH